MSDKAARAELKCSCLWILVDVYVLVALVECEHMCQGHDDCTVHAVEYLRIETVLSNSERCLVRAPLSNSLASSNAWMHAFKLKFPLCKEELIDDNYGLIPDLLVSLPTTILSRQVATVSGHLSPRVIDSHSCFSSQLLLHDHAVTHG